MIRSHHYFLNFFSRFYSIYELSQHLQWRHLNLTWIHLQVSVPIMSLNECRHRMQSNDFYHDITDNQLCAGSSDGKQDTCEVRGVLTYDLVPNIGLRSLLIIIIQLIGSIIVCPKVIPFSRFQCGSIQQDTNAVLWKTSHKTRLKNKKLF